MALTKIVGSNEVENNQVEVSNVSKHIFEKIGQHHGHDTENCDLSECKDLIKKQMHLSKTDVQNEALQSLYLIQEIKDVENLIEIGENLRGGNGRESC